MVYSLYLCFLNTVTLGNALVIVESPAKAKTIEKYLGPGYTVASSFGHIRDLPKSGMAVDIAGEFEPTYQIPDDKKEVVRKLKGLMKGVDMVYLASDDDREGEAISWHLAEALGLKPANMKRIVFHEITKTAVTNAIAHPRTIDQNLVNAQQARRVLDRLVGYELSPVLWKKIQTGLSAGRVQSVAVRLLVEREREIDAFQANAFFKVTALFLVDGKVMKADLKKNFATEEEARAFLESCLGASFTIADLEQKRGKRTPAAPFTTSTLQQEASRKLSFSVAQTMRCAQKLYEAGHITYMRTDSLNLSEQALTGIKAEIVKEYGAEYSEVRTYKTKSQGAQEAHEAIRPTEFGKRTAGNDAQEQRLYDLIWKRTIASQMSEAVIDKTVATISISTNKEIFTATGEVITFDGFLKVYMESTDDEETEEKNTMLPPLSVGQLLTMEEIMAKQSFTKALPRYTEASLVKKLEELGIGRPSTYAPTISTIQNRGYVEKESRDGVIRPYRELVLKQGTIHEATKEATTGNEKNKLFPTNLAMVVIDFLVAHFPEELSYSFTREVEEEFDNIAQGKKKWNTMIKEFYRGFHERVITTAEIDRSEAKKDRLLGVDPKTGKNVYTRLARFGPVVQLGEQTEDAKPTYAKLDVGQYMETITLEEALKLFLFPKNVGTYEGEEMLVNKGRFGPYIKHKESFFSIPKEVPLGEITEAQAIEIIEAKRLADREKFIKSFPENPDVQVLKGRFGPYIKGGGKNVKIPKGKEPTELTLEECLQLIADAPEPRGRFAKKKEDPKKTEKKPAKKAPAKKKATTTKKAAPKKTVAKKTPAKKASPKKEA